MDRHKKGQFSGGILTAVLVFVVIAVFLSMSAVSLNDLIDETSGDTTDTSFNVTDRALESIDTFSGFLNPFSFILVGAFFIFLIGFYTVKSKK